MLKLANHTKRQFDDIRIAWQEFRHDISNPLDALLLIAAILFLAVLILTPWIVADGGFR